LKPVEIVAPLQIKLKGLFKKAELKYVFGGDVVAGDLSLLRPVSDYR